MSYQQLKPFDKKTAGSTPGLCLQNTRKGFGIPAKYKNATTAWEHTQQHANRDIPAGVDVPLFYSWLVDGHINVRLADGTVWNDGKIYPSLDDFLAKAPIIPKPKFLGWGESINDRMVVQNKEEDMSKMNTGIIYNMMYWCLTPAIAERAKADNFKNYFGHLAGMETNQAIDIMITSHQWGLLKQEAFPLGGNVPPGTYLKVNKADVIEAK